MAQFSCRFPRWGTPQWTCLMQNWVSKSFHCSLVLTQILLAAADMETDWSLPFAEMWLFLTLQMHATQRQLALKDLSVQMMSAVTLLQQQDFCGQWTLRTMRTIDSCNSISHVWPTEPASMTCGQSHSDHCSLLSTAPVRTTHACRVQPMTQSQNFWLGIVWRLHWAIAFAKEHSQILILTHNFSTLKLFVILLP